MRTLRQRIRLAEQTLAPAADEAQVQAVRRQLRAAGEDVRRARADAEAAEIAERSAEETAQARAMIEAVRRQAAVLDSARSERFDPDALRDVAARLGDAEEDLIRGRITGCRRLAGAAAERLEVHRRVVAERFEVWSGQKERAEAEIAAVEDLLAGLKVDEVFGRWCAAEGEALRRRAADLAEAARGERFAAVARESAALLDEAQRLTARAQDLQLRHERHQYVVRGIIEAMRQEGFVIQNELPASQQAGRTGETSGAVLIHAERLDGGTLAVSVPQEGAVTYEVDGYPLDVVAGVDWREVAVCDEAEARIRTRTGHGGEDWYILKPIAAGPGDRVDTTSDWLVINGRRIAPLVRLDAAGQSLPTWKADRVLGADEFFVFSGRIPNSFDSRCYGPIRRDQIESVRQPLLTW